MKKESKILVKTILLTLFAIFLAHWLSDILGIEALTKIGPIGWIILFLWYSVFMYIGLKILDKFIK
jgi:hypothetical protein